MTRKFASKCAIFLLAAGVCSAATATKRRLDFAAGQEPARVEAERETAQKPPNCIADKSGFKPDKTYVVELTNLCEQRVRCKISAYVVTSRGPTTGRKTITLAPASKGASARKVYVMKLREAGGTADVSRHCKVL